MLQLARIIQDARTLKALIGMGRAEFDGLPGTFTQVIERQALGQPRVRAPGGGFKVVLGTPSKLRSPRNEESLLRALLPQSLSHLRCAWSALRQAPRAQL